MPPNAKPPFSKSPIAKPPVAGPDEGPAAAKSVRQRIVDAALELARTVGVQGMSQARVAKAAGVRQSHLTYYFPSRADLIKATVYAIRDQMLEATQAALQITDQGVDPLESLRQFCLREVCDLPKARLLLSIMVVAEEEASLHPWIDELHQESLTQWQAIYRALGIDAREEDVELFHASFVGATLLGAQTGSEAAIRRAVRATEMAFDRLVQGKRRKSRPE